MRKLLMMILALTMLFSGSVMLTSCAKDQMKEDQGLMSDEKARKEAEEKARLERDRMAREKAIQEERLKGEQEQQRLREEFQNKKIYFAFDSATLSEEAQDALREKADFLKQHTDKTVLIEGHCDDRGSVEYNLALGQRRAETAMKYLTLLGISSDRIRTISYGKERPANTGNNEEAWAQNRRDEFVLE